MASPKLRRSKPLTVPHPIRVPIYPPTIAPKMPKTMVIKQP